MGVYAAEDATRQYRQMERAASITRPCGAILALQRKPAYPAAARAGRLSGAANREGAMSRGVYQLGVGMALVALAFVVTDWALSLRPGVTEANVKRVRPGMRLEEVRRLLGE